MGRQEREKVVKFQDLKNDMADTYGGRVDGIQESSH